MNSTLGKSRVFVDADSCPVKAEIVEIARFFNLEVHFVASYEHVITSRSLEGNWHFVDSYKEAADLFIMNHVQEKDVAITQDIGLAATLLSKGAFVIHPRGQIYVEKDIESQLHMRYLSAKARRRGEFGKGPKPFTETDRSRFKKNFTEILSKIKGNL